MPPPEPPLSRSKSFRQQMQNEGIALSELYDVDTVDPEAAETLVFRAKTNSWERLESKIKVARRMFAHGENYGCIRMRDLDDGRVKILKKALMSKSEDDLYDAVKSHSLGVLCCELFSKSIGPNFNMTFSNRVIYKLLQRSNCPKILCEEQLTENDAPDEFVKTSLSLHPPRNASQEETMESHLWALFQFFTYYQSEKGMVFERCQVAQGTWMNPIIHSNDQTLGGSCDGGHEGIERWAREFEDKYSELFDVSPAELMALDIEAMSTLFERHRCLPWTMGPPAPSPPHSAGEEARLPLDYTESSQRDHGTTRARGLDLAVDKMRGLQLAQANGRDAAASPPRSPSPASYLPTTLTTQPAKPVAVLPAASPGKPPAQRSPNTARSPSGDGSVHSANTPRVLTPVHRASSTSRPVDMVLKLRLDMARAGPDDSAEREAFKDQVVVDLATAANVPMELFEVRRLSAGSIIIETRVHPDPAGRCPSPHDMAEGLLKQASDPGSQLMQGVLTRHTEAIALPTLRPDSMRALLAPSASPVLPPPAAGERAGQTGFDADDVQLAALKSRLNRYEREHEESASASKQQQHSLTAAAVPALRLSPRGLRSSAMSGGVPSPAPQSPRHVDEPRRAPVVAPVAKVLEETVQPASGPAGFANDSFDHGNASGGSLTQDATYRFGARTPGARAVGYAANGNGKQGDGASPAQGAHTPSKNQVPAKSPLVGRKQSAPAQDDGIPDWEKELRKPTPSPTVNWGAYRQQVMAHGFE